MEPDEIVEDAPLTADEVLTFGPVVEAQVWSPIWLQESRAPIAVAAGRAKLGKVFDDNGVGKAVVIRPCMSRGRRVRGLPPVYTPQMLERHAGVFDGWPMFLDHVPAELQAALAKRGRSVKELGGQLLNGSWARDFVQEGDADFGYRQGAIVADIWATPFIRRTVGENPNLLHTSINAWPTSGKPGPVPWRPKMKGMLIEGIRRQPQGSVDYVVRGGAGGRLLVAEGLEDEGEWPEIGEWSEDDRRFVVSLAESFYASAGMKLELPTKPEELAAWLREQDAEHLLPALAEANDDDADDKTPRKPKSKPADDPVKESGLTEADVKRILGESLSSELPSVEDFERSLQERMDETLQERDEQRSLSARAFELIEQADGIPNTWKSDLKARYAMLPSGAPSALLVESAVTDSDGNELTAVQVVEQRVKDDLQHTRELIAEAQGRPRPTGEGGGKPSSGGESTSSRKHTPLWRERFVSMGLAESADKAEEAFGGKVQEANAA